MAQKGTGAVTVADGVLAKMVREATNACVEQLARHVTLPAPVREKLRDRLIPAVADALNKVACAGDDEKYQCRNCGYHN